MIHRYTKIPVTIEAIQFTRNNVEEIKAFVGKSFGGYRVEKCIGGRAEIVIHTLEDGELYLVSHVASENDYIIKGAKGEFYACKPDIFELTYKLSENED